MAVRQSSKALKQRAADLRKIAVKSKFKVGRHIAKIMADECERKAAKAQKAEHRSRH
jgi:hypothetical protein